MKRAFVVSVLVLGCGGGKPVPAKPVAKPVATAAPTPAPSAPSCHGAARSLVHERGLGKVAKDRQDDARAAAEAEVVAACLDDQWTAVVIACTATRAAPSTCLGQLTEDQEQSLRAHLSDWEANWTRGADRRADEPPRPPPEEDATPGELPRPQDPAQEEWISCTSSIGDVATYEPQLKPGAVDRDYAIVVRTSALRRSCELHWANPAKKCFGAARDAAGIAACRATLDAQGKNGIVNALADADAKVAQVQALAKTARAIDCKAVAAAHYTDDLLRHKLTALDPAERRRVFAESRTTMATACTKEKWSPTVRACIASAPATDYGLEECFVGNAARAMYRFGVPAQGVFFKSGIAECDALGDAVKKVMACDKIEPTMKSILVGSYAMQLAMWLDSPGGSRLEIVKQCKETQTYLERDARERGCVP